MATYSTTTHGPSSAAPDVTNLVAVCAVCKTQWQVKGDDLEDAKSCPFCGVGNDYGAITTYDEAPGYGEATIYNGGSDTNPT